MGMLLREPARTVVPVRMSRESSLRAGSRIVGRGQCDWTMARQSSLLSILQGCDATAADIRTGLRACINSADGKSQHLLKSFYTFL